MTSLTVSSTAHASDAGAFLGGVLATKVVGNMRRRTEAEEVQAAASVQQAQNQQAQPSTSSAEARIKQLDKIAAGGYITPAEYKSKKKAILDGL